MSLLSRGCSLGLIVLLLGSPVAAQDLTGIWHTEGGGRYVVRHVGDEFCWVTDPVNVFCGRVVGTLIVGSWLDLPTGPFRGWGRLILKIESPNRFIKVYETASYGGTVWTREGTQVAGPVTSTANPPPVSAPPTARPGGDPGPMSGTSPAPSDVKRGTMDWTYRAIGDEYRDRIGAKIEFTCPPDLAPMEWRATYGTGIYTGDSVLCQAAVHDGQITTAGGTVVVEIRPGQASYTGSRQHGVISADYGAWGISFSFVPPVRWIQDVGAPPPTTGRTQTGLPPAAPPPTAGTPTRPAPQTGVQEGGTVNWESVVAPDLRTRIGTRVSYQCPPGGRFYGYVWGTGVYTGDSYPCAAAVHMGVITFASGGTITIEIRPGQASYVGSARNGVSSRDFGEYPTSFVVVR